MTRVFVVIKDRNNKMHTVIKTRDKNKTKLSLLGQWSCGPPSYINEVIFSLVFHIG